MSPPVPHRERSPARRTARWPLLLAATLLLAGCGAPTLSLEELALEAEDYDGEDVTTHGVVREFDADDGALERHFVIQDADEHRVRLVPPEEAEPHVGSPVVVSGEFQYDQERGRALQVDTIEPAG